MQKKKKKTNLNFSAGRCNRKLLKGSFNNKAYYLPGIIMKWVNNNNYRNHNSNSNNQHLLSPYYVSGTVGNALHVLTHSISSSHSVLFTALRVSQWAAICFSCLPPSPSEIFQPMTHSQTTHQFTKIFKSLREEKNYRKKRSSILYCILNSVFYSLVISFSNYSVSS